MIIWIKFDKVTKTHKAWEENVYCMGFESVYTNLIDLNVLKSFVRAGDEGNHEQYNRATV